MKKLLKKKINKSNNKVVLYAYERGINFFCF